MRVGLFLLLSLGVHLAAGQWLDWGTPPRISSAATAEQVGVVALPRMVRMTAPEPVVEPPAEPLVEPLPEPVAPQVVARTERPDPVPAPREPPTKTPQPSRTAATEPPTAEAPATPEPPAAAQEQPASMASAPQPSAQPPALPAAEPEEVVSQQPRFREPPAAPVYPAQARRRNQQGQVLVEVRLDAEGQQRRVTVLQSSGFTSLDRAALEAVADWKFQPELLAGRPTPSRVRIPIDFALSRR